MQPASLTVCVPDIFRDVEGRAYRIYGDSIYASKANTFLYAPFTGVLILESHQRFNKLMASFRIAVEWRYMESKGAVKLTSYRTSYHLLWCTVCLSIVFPAALGN